MLKKNTNQVNFYKPVTWSRVPEVDDEWELGTSTWSRVPEVDDEWEVGTPGGGGGGGGGGYSDLVPTGVCRWSRQTRTYL